MSQFYVNVSDSNIPPDVLTAVDVQTGISPVVPSANTITFNGATVAAGTNPVRTDGTGASTMALEVQLSQAIASTDATKVGLAAFDSAHFTVDANGFVTTTGFDAFKWSDTSGTVNAIAFNGYFITAVCTSTLPASPAEGDTIVFIVATGGALTIKANTGQVISIGSTNSSSAGTAVNNAIGDSVTLIYRATSTTWIASSVIGTFTLA